MGKDKGAPTAGAAGSGGMGSPLPAAEPVAKGGVRSQSEVAMEATRRVRREQERQATVKVRVVATKRFWDGFRMHEEGDRFVYAYNEKLRWPSALVKEEDFEEQERTRRRADRDAELADLDNED